MGTCVDIFPYDGVVTEESDRKKMKRLLLYVHFNKYNRVSSHVYYQLTQMQPLFSKVVESEFGYHIIQLIDRRGDKVNVRHILLKPNVSIASIDAAANAGSSTPRPI